MTMFTSRPTPPPAKAGQTASRRDEDRKADEPGLRPMRPSFTARPKPSPSEAGQTAPRRDEEERDGERPAEEPGPRPMTTLASRSGSSPGETGATVLRRDEDGIAILTLDRPEARNALSLAMLAELQELLEEIGDDTRVRAVILAANGSVFSAGHDLRELRETSRRDGKREGYERVFRLCSRVMLTLHALPQPVIAQVQGVATAAGCQLVATCDLAVASREARFGTPGVNIGLFCSTPMVALSRAVGRKLAMEMLLTGDLIDAETARAIGLVNRVVPAEALAEETMALATKVASKSSFTVSIGKEAFYRQAEMDLRAAYTFASDVMVRNMMADDAEEGIGAFLEKREPSWRNR